MGDDGAVAPEGAERMNIVGVMVYWNESPTWLSSCVSGFAGVCDTIIAVDGAYQLMPGGRPRSHPSQAYAIQDACEAAGVGCVIHRPGDVWHGNEVGKRQHTVELARAFDPDWVLVFDSDYLVMKLDAPTVRSILQHTDKHVATYLIVDHQDQMADPVVAEYARAKPTDNEWTVRDRGIFRWTDDLRYGPAHYCVRGTYDGEEQWLRGPDLWLNQTEQAAEAEHLLGSLAVWHRREQRPAMRNIDARQFAALRDAAGVEDVSHLLLESSVA